MHLGFQKVGAIQNDRHLRHLIITSVTFLLTTHLFGQTPKNSSISFHVSPIITFTNNFSRNTYDPQVTLQRSMGYSAGVSFQKSINQYFICEIALNRVSKGRSTLYNSFPTSSTFNIHYPTVEIAPSINVIPLLLNKIRAIIQIGCSLDLIPRHGTSSSDGPYFHIEEKNYRTTSYTPFLGLHLEKKFRNKSFYSGIAFHYGIQPVGCTIIQTLDMNGSLLHSNTYYSNGNYLSVNFGVRFFLHKDQISN